MDDTKVMLRSIINGQSSMKSELLSEIKKISKKTDDLENKMDKGFKELKSEILENRKRLDKFGYRLAELEYDAPTHDEFEKLVNRVAKIEHSVAFA